eukprot:746228-Alexandrium_andersonii.AAC.1
MLTPQHKAAAAPAHQSTGRGAGGFEFCCGPPCHPKSPAAPGPRTSGRPQTASQSSLPARRVRRRLERRPGMA